MLNYRWQVNPARILGILQFVPCKCNQDPAITLPLICWMQHITKKTAHQMACPLPLVQYEFVHPHLSIQLIEPASIVGPAAAYPTIEQLSSLDNTLETARLMRYWLLPFSLLRRCRTETLPFLSRWNVDEEGSVHRLFNFVPPDHSVSGRLINRTGAQASKILDAEPLVEDADLALNVEDEDLDKEDGYSTEGAYISDTSSV